MNGRIGLPRLAMRIFRDIMFLMSGWTSGGKPDAGKQGGAAPSG